MKISFWIVLFFTLSISSCEVMMPYSKTQPAPPPDKDTISISEAKEKDEINTFYSKYYKYVSPQGSIRYSARMYYGLQEEILKEFALFDVHHPIIREELSKFPIASFFSPTAITIPSDKKSMAELLYKPLLDTIFMQSNKSTELHAEIVVLGFTDETNPFEDSTLYLDVLAKSQKETLSKQEFYYYTSYFRAKEIGDMLSKLILDRKPTFKKYDKIIIDLIQEGRGTEFPDVKRSYEAEDDKRRITKVYWKLYQQ